jgi:Rrf2 family transcriptional regulator, iron-sulfur cluster assembly transcription factor
MRLSTKGRYAVTAMMHVAIYNKVGPVTLADISVCQGISLSYLEQIFARLRRQGLVEGIRGPGGGYRLARQPNEITVAEIFAAVDEKAGVARGNGELTDELWADLSRQIHSFLSGITLAEFVERPSVQEVAQRQQRHREKAA